MVVTVLIRHSRGRAVGRLLLRPVGVPCLPVDQALLDPVMLQGLLWSHPDIRVPSTNNSQSLSYSDSLS